MSDEIKNEKEAPKTEPSAELAAPVLDNVIGGVSTGKHIPSAKLHVRKAGEDPQLASDELSADALGQVAGGTHPIDKTSPVLMQACATAVPVKQ
jgi:hypothetical protein